MADPTARKDVIWQRPETVAGYGQSRPGIPFSDAQFDLVERVLRAHGAEMHKVLDLGCGDGIAAQSMLDRFPVEQAVLVDFSEPMLAQARERFAVIDQKVTTMFGDLLSSDWLPDVASRGPYNLVISRYAIHHLPHERKRSLYDEIFALLAPDGWFVNIEHVKSVNRSYQAAFDALLVDGVHRVVSDARTREDVERSYHQRQDAETNILAPAEDQCQWLQSSGFVDVDIVFKALELAVIAGRKP